MPDWFIRWDVVLMVIAAYVAVMSLVRLMIRRRDLLIADVQRQLQAQRPKAKKKSTNQDDGQPKAA